MVVGTVAFAGIGLALAGRLRGEVNLAAANGLYLVLLLLGGMIFPLDELPGRDWRRWPSCCRAPRWPRSCGSALTTGAAPGSGLGDAAGMGRGRPGWPPAPSAGSRPTRSNGDATSVRPVAERSRRQGPVAGRSGSGAGGTVSNTRVTSS